MRHIPEEELHAYLDQGLSRSQCVEIESHLASCPSCQAARDAIAALRDRTTALLAKLAPPRGFPPVFDSLRRRAAMQASARRRRIRLAAWVASLVAAVGLGWMANYFLTTRAPTPSALASRSVVQLPIRASATPAAVAAPFNSSPVAARSVPGAHRGRRHATLAISEATVTLPPVVAPATLQFSSVDVPHPEPELNGMWRTMSWDGAQAEAGDKLPHIDGLPVVQVQLQLLPSDRGKQPLMVVAQQLSSGEVIRTMEGPTNEVSHLLAQRAISDSDPTFARIDSNGSSSGPDRTMAMQRGDRMLVITGALPSDSLLAMIRRLNAEMRSK
ncbi:MAG TPA: anti-sigma factor [Gemmatimonadales bacterium]